jgi:hypothetical protein
LAKAGIVQDDEQHIGRALFRPQWLRLGRAGLVKGPADDAVEGGAGFILFQEHFSPRACWVDRYELKGEISPDRDIQQGNVKPLLLRDKGRPAPRYGAVRPAPDCIPRKISDHI